MADRANEPFIVENLEDLVKKITREGHRFPEDHTQMAQSLETLRQARNEILGMQMPSRTTRQRADTLLAQIRSYALHMQEHLAFTDILVDESTHSLFLSHLKQDLLVRAGQLAHPNPIYYADLPRPHYDKRAIIQDLTSRFFSQHEMRYFISVNNSTYTDKFRLERREQAAAHLAKQFGNRTRHFTHIPYVTIHVEKKDEAKLLKELHAYTTTAHYERLGILQDACILPASLMYIPEIITGRKKTPVGRKTLWNLAAIGADQASRITLGDGIAVGIIDTGVDYMHDELVFRFDRADPGWNYIDWNNDVRDKEGHGTHVAGIVAGKTVGVAPGVQLKAYVVLDEEGSGSEADVMHAYDDAIDQVAVINMSLGGTYYNPAFEELTRAAFRKGVLTSAAAGNEGFRDVYSYPAAYDGVLSIAATGRNDEWLTFSNANDENDLAAPGDRIYSSVPGGYAELTGTSMASPHVAGALALIRSLYSGSGEEVYALMKQGDCVKHLPYPEKKVGAGLVRPDYVLTALGKLGMTGGELLAKR